MSVKKLTFPAKFRLIKAADFCQLDVNKNSIVDIQQMALYIAAAAPSAGNQCSSVILPHTYPTTDLYIFVISLYIGQCF